MRGLLRAALAAAMLLLLAPAPAAASSSGFGVEAAPSRIDFKLKPGQIEITARLSLVNRCTSAMQARLSATDVVIDKAGAWQLLPAGSTPYGFPSLLAVQVVDLPVGRIVPSTSWPSSTTCARCRAASWSRRSPRQLRQLRHGCQLPH